jgi:hypothetical protein
MAVAKPTAATKKPPEAGVEDNAEQEPVVEPMTVKQLADLAHEYHVPMAESVLQDIVGDGKVANPEKVQAFEAYLQEAASGLFPTFAPQIKAGIKTAYLLDPYRQVGKKVLGDKFEPDFVGDPRSSIATNGGNDPKSGRPIPMTLEQWAQHLKTEPSFNWIKTPAGQANLRKVMASIQQGFEGKNAPAGAPPEAPGEEEGATPPAAAPTGGGQ